MSSAQLSFDVLPVVDPAFERDALRERWLEHLLACAEALEREQARWWTGATLANRMLENPARIGPALRCLACRGALVRDQIGVTMRGVPVFVYAVSDGLPGRTFAGWPS